jgi:hypothetical protein
MDNPSAFPSDTFTDPSPHAKSRLVQRLKSKTDISASVKRMPQTQALAEDDLLVSLTLHNFSAEMLKEFAQKIVKPYFRGNINEAVRSLMEKAIQEESLLNQTIIAKE